jgi:hypothetical protein
MLCDHVQKSPWLFITFCLLAMQIFTYTSVPSTNIQLAHCRIFYVAYEATLLLKSSTLPQRLHRAFHRALQLVQQRHSPMYT